MPFRPTGEGGLSSDKLGYYSKIWNTVFKFKNTAAEVISVDEFTLNRVSTGMEEFLEGYGVGDFGIGKKFRGSFRFSARIVNLYGGAPTAPILAPNWASLSDGKGDLIFSVMYSDDAAPVYKTNPMYKVTILLGLPSVIERVGEDRDRFGRPIVPSKHESHTHISYEEKMERLPWDDPKADILTDVARMMKDLELKTSAVVKATEVVSASIGASMRRELSKVNATRRPAGKCVPNFNEDEGRWFCSCWDKNIWCAAVDRIIKSRSGLLRYTDISSAVPRQGLLQWTEGYIDLPISFFHPSYDEGPRTDAVVMESNVQKNIFIELSSSRSDNLTNAINMFRGFFTSTMDFRRISSIVEATWERDYTSSDALHIGCIGKSHTPAKQRMRILRAKHSGVSMPSVILGEAYSLNFHHKCGGCNTTTHNYAADIPF